MTTTTGPKPPFSLIEMLGLLIPKIEVVDVGAMDIAGDAYTPYQPLLRTGLTRVVGFEPVQEECDKLNASTGVDPERRNNRYLPYFVGDGTPRTFYLCNFSMTSSLYPPNRRVLDRFHNLGELTRVVSTESVQTRRLDDITDITSMDMLKIDVQGAELDVFKGASRLLKSTLVVHTEVEFLPMYEGQPLFGDVDRYLREQGFLLHTLFGIMGRAFKPVLVNNNINQPLNQQLWSDAVYVRSFLDFRELAPKDLLKIAIMMHECYLSLDLAALALQYYDEKLKGQVQGFPHGLWGEYMRRLTGRTVTERPPLD